MDVPTAFSQADAVFEGRVLEVERAADPSAPLRVTLEVVQQWKGVESERVVVETPSNSAMCGVAFEPSTSWLVYAAGEGEVRTVSLCSRTARIEDASEDLAELGAGVVPVEITADDEVEPPAARRRPARGGCASCSASASASERRAVAIALLALAALLARRR